MAQGDSTVWAPRRVVSSVASEMPFLVANVPGMPISLLSRALGASGGVASARSDAMVTVKSASTAPGPGMGNIGRQSSPGAVTAAAALRDSEGQRGPVLPPPRPQLQLPVAAAAVATPAGGGGGAAEARESAARRGVRGVPPVDVRESSALYKLVAVVDAEAGRYVSVFDGVTPYTVGATTVAEARGAGGLYAYAAGAKRICISLMGAHTHMRSRMAHHTTRSMAPAGASRDRAQVLDGARGGRGALPAPGGTAGRAARAHPRALPRGRARARGPQCVVLRAADRPRPRGPGAASARAWGERGRRGPPRRSSSAGARRGARALALTVSHEATTGFW